MQLPNSKLDPMGDLRRPPPEGLLVVYVERPST